MFKTSGYLEIFQILHIIKLDDFVNLMNFQRKSFISQIKLFKFQWKKLNSLMASKPK